MAFSWKPFIQVEEQHRAQNLRALATYDHLWGWGYLLEHPLPFQTFAFALGVQNPAHACVHSPRVKPAFSYPCVKVPSFPTGLLLLLWTHEV